MAQLWLHPIKPKFDVRRRYIPDGVTIGSQIVVEAIHAFVIAVVEFSS